MVILDNNHLPGIATTPTTTNNTTFMPVEDTTAFKILPTIGIYNTHDQTPPNGEDQLAALPTVHASELFVGDDPKVDLTFIN
ncbi:UNVERIFIED_CONTAM: hypothetical protein RMT77_019917, partial [Armadillidium vulgare]